MNIIQNENKPHNEIVEMEIFSEFELKKNNEIEVSLQAQSHFAGETYQPLL